MYKKIILGVENRRENIELLNRQISGSEVFIDKNGDALLAFIEVLKTCKDDACLLFEDDIVLCENFDFKADKIIQDNRNQVITFFSMRKDDLKIGTRFITGSRFCMNQCVYLPAFFAKKIVDFYYRDFQYLNFSGQDTMIALYLKKNKLKYLNVVPNLVNHLPVVSEIDRRRSKYRQSLTFDK